MQALVLEETSINALYALLYKRVTGRINLDFASALRLKRYPEPSVKDDAYVKVKTRLCGICGTDISRMDIGRAQLPGFARVPVNRRGGPAFLGHEIVGEVVEVGPAVEQLAVGDRVTVADNNNCIAFGIEECEFCQQGMPILCTNKHLRKYADSVYGGWSEFFVRHENQLFRIPESMPDDIAVLMETVSVSLHSVLRKPPKPDSRILVIGGGAIGLGIVLALRALGIEPLSITLVARHGFQRELGLKLGANHAISDAEAWDRLPEILQTPVFGSDKSRILNDGFHQVYDCVLSQATVNDAVHWLRPRGNLIAVGMNSQSLDINFAPLVYRELSVVGVHGYAYDRWEGVEQHTVERCIEWAASGRLKVDDLLTHKFSLSNYKQAFDTALSHYGSDYEKAESCKAIKVAFDFTRTQAGE